MKSNNKNLKINKLFFDFDFLRKHRTGVSLQGSARVIFRRSLARLLDSFSFSQIEKSMEVFFKDEYADSAEYPFQLFIKQFEKYLLKYRPSIGKISFGELFQRHYPNPESNEDLTIRNTDREIDVIRRMEEKDYGTIYDLSLEDVERAIAKKAWNETKVNVPQSWVESYFNRLEIYENKSRTAQELEKAEKEKEERKKVQDRKKEKEELISRVEEEKFLYTNKESPSFNSKKFKFNHILSNFNNQKLRDLLFCCETPKDFDLVIKKIKDIDENNHI